MKIAISLIFTILFCAVRPATAHISQDMPDAVAEMEYRILLDFQPEKNDVRNKLGMALFRMKKIDQAEKEFKIVLANDPKNFNATDAMGLVLLKRGEARKALAQFKAAIAIKSSDILVYYHLGLAYIQLKNLPMAQAALKACLKKSVLPDQPPLNKQVRKKLLKVKETLAQVNKDLLTSSTPTVLYPQMYCNVNKSYRYVS